MFRSLKRLGFPNYMVSSQGDVLSLNKDAVITARDNGHGYRFVTLYHCGAHKRFYVHRIVAMIYLKNPENKPQVNHINGDKSNNKYWNLEWAASSENHKHAFENGLSKFDHMNRSKKVINIGTGKVYGSEAIACRQLGLERHAIQKSIANNYKCGGYYWRYVDGK